MSEFKVVDKRGEEFESNELQTHAERMVADKHEKAKGKPQVIPHMRCPVCKANRPKENYLLNIQFQCYACLECGGMFMDKVMVRNLYQESVKQRSRVEVNFK